MEKGIVVLPISMISRISLPLLLASLVGASIGPQVNGFIDLDQNS